MNEVLKKVSDTVTNEPVVVTVDIKPNGWLDALFRKVRLRPTVREFRVSQITVGNLIKMSGLLITIDRNIFHVTDNKDRLQASFEAIYKHGHTVAEIIAIALHNRPGNTPASLVNFIKSNFTATEIYNVLTVIIRQMEVSVFTTTIISIGKLNILESQTVNVSSVNGAGVSH